MSNNQGGPEQPDTGPQPYEHPALEPEQGYWAGRWAEFTRLLSNSWNDGFTKPVVIASAVVFVVTGFGIRFLGWE